MLAKGQGIAKGYWGGKGGQENMTCSGFDILIFFGRVGYHMGNTPVGRHFTICMIIKMASDLGTDLGTVLTTISNGMDFL